jgi:hypothetical protein
MKRSQFFRIPTEGKEVSRGAAKLDREGRNKRTTRHSLVSRQPDSAVNVVACHDLQTILLYKQEERRRGKREEGSAGRAKENDEEKRRRTNERPELHVSSVYHHRYILRLLDRLQFERFDLRTSTVNISDLSLWLQRKRSRKRREETANAPAPNAPDSP